MVVVGSARSLAMLALATVASLHAQHVPKITQNWEEVDTKGLRNPCSFSSARWPWIVFPVGCGVGDRPRPIALSDAAETTQGLILFAILILILHGLFVRRQEALEAGGFRSYYIKVRTQRSVGAHVWRA